MVGHAEKTLPGAYVLKMSNCNNWKKYSEFDNQQFWVDYYVWKMEPQCTSDFMFFDVLHKMLKQDACYVKKQHIFVSDVTVQEKCFGEPTL